MLDEFERVRTSSRNETAGRYVGLFERYVWEPFVSAGMPNQAVEQAANVIGVLREAAIDVVSGAVARPSTPPRPTRSHAMPARRGSLAPQKTQALS